MMDKKNLDLVVAAFLGLAVVMYDVTIDLALQVVHFLFEIIHNLYEVFELAIEHAVEHMFHTDRHGSQVITFYILVTIASFLFYRLWRITPRLCRAIRQWFLTAWVRRSTQLQLYWQSLTLLHKIALALTGIAVGYVASFFVM